MDRINTSTKAVNLFGAGKHGFTNGVPGTAAMPTAFDAAWFNAVQEEISNVVEGAGLALNPLDNTQLLQAVRATISRGGVTPTMFGALGGGADDTVAVQAWAASLFPKMGEPKVFRVTSEISFAAGAMVVAGRGMVIDGRSGTYARGAVLYCEGALTALPSLAASPAQGDVTLVFAAAHNLLARDVATIYNPADSSWSTKQTYYKAGEFFKAAHIASATQVKLLGGLYAGYAAASVNLYKLASNEVALSNLTVLAPNAGTMSPIRIRLATKVRIRDVSGLEADYTGINLDRCYDVHIDGAEVSVPVQAAPAKYGVSVGNCQHVRINGSNLNAVRHAVNVGGDSFVGCVPNRDVIVDGSYLANDAALSQVNCCDVHGNSQHVTYSNNHIKGGGSFGGRDCHYIDNHFLDFNYATGAVVYGGSEWLGGVAEVRGGSITSSLANTLGLVRLSTDANVNGDSTLVFEGTKVKAPLCDVVARCDLAASTHKVNAVVRNITIESMPNLANVLRMTGTGAAGDGDFIVVEGIEGPPADLLGAALYAATAGYGATVKARLQRQEGTAAVVPVSGAAVASTAVSYPMSYGPKSPTVMLALGAHKVNGKSLGAAHRAKGAGGFTADLFTTDAASFGATAPTVLVDWSAAVCEF